MPFEHCGTLDVATRRAAAAAQVDVERGGGDQVVLLSPACASYDQFSDFEKRGDMFRECVKSLLNASP